MQRRLAEADEVDADAAVHHALLRHLRQGEAPALRLLRLLGLLGLLGLVGVCVCVSVSLAAGLVAAGLLVQAKVARARRDDHDAVAGALQVSAGRGQGEEGEVSRREQREPENQRTREPENQNTKRTN